MSRTHINPDGLVDAPGIGYNHAIVEDGTLYGEQPFPCLTILGPESLAQEAFLVELEIEAPVE